MAEHDGIEISEDDFPEMEAVAAIQRGLHAYNQEMGGPYDREPVTVLARDASGAVRGGLLGLTYWNWLFIDWLWLARDMRGKGLGARLFDRAVVHARNQGVGLLFIHALSENTAMLKIARKSGARVVRDGSESDAYLSLPAADMDSQMNEFIEEGMADVDFQIKVRAKQFSQVLRTLQEVRRGVRESRHKSGV
jgi:GNAT superfamily N-acetyltransferase